MSSNILIFGCIGKEPNLIYTNNNTPICNLSLAETNENNKTTWHNIVIFGKEAELCKASFKKGQNIFVKGPVKITSWTDKDKKLKMNLEVIANQIGTTFFNKTIPYIDG